MAIDRDEVSQATVQFVGSVLHLDTFTNAVNLGLALSPVQLSRWKKQVRGQLTQLMKHNFQGLSGHDRQAVLESALAVLKNAQMDDTFVRMSRDPDRLWRFMVASAGEVIAPVTRDENTRAPFLSVMSILCGWISLRIQEMEEHRGVLLAETMRDVRELEGQHREHGRKLTDLATEVAELKDHQATRAVPSYATLPLLNAQSWTLPTAFVGRAAEMHEVTELVGSGSLLCVSGYPLSGRAELLRQWSLENRDPEHVWIIDWRQTDSAAEALADLAGFYGAQRRSGMYDTLSAILDAAPAATLILTGIADVRPLVERHTQESEDRGLLLAVLDHVDQRDGSFALLELRATGPGPHPPPASGRAAGCR